MTGIIIIGIIIYVIYIATKKKPNQQYFNTNKRNNEQKSKKELRDELIQNITKNIKVTVTSSNDNYNDESIIDVSDHSYRINSNGSLKKHIEEVPYWKHQYVYSYSEINSASIEQKSFYKTFKIDFLNNENIDLEGNTNYAFILLFDLLNEFDSHKDIPKLERQLKILGKSYPKTKSYGMNFLIRIMEENGDNESLSRVLEEERHSYQNYNSGYDYDYWSLGSKYKTKLKLNDDEVELLNQLWYPSNNFCSIEYCCIEVLKLFIAVVFNLKNKYKIEETTLDLQLKELADVIARKQHRFRNGSWNYKSSVENTPREIFSLIFKHCENAVRGYYGHKRKLNTDTHYTNEEAKKEYELKILSKIEEIIPALVSKIALPDEPTEIELYSQTTTRWKIKFEELKTIYSKTPKSFVDEIITLGQLNKKNPSVENIFFEASKYISKFDKESALLLYVHYIHQDLKSVKFDNKQLTKTITKNIFKTKEQLENFEKIVNEFIVDKNLDKALEGVSKVYKLNRKKIKLNKASIKEVQNQHSGTIELLNEYLKDDFEDEASSESRKDSEEEIEIKIIPQKKRSSKSPFINELVLSEIQTTVLLLFVKSNFSIPEEELKIFAKTNGVFKNQLIESINEICYEILDDILIEEKEEHYTINTNYFNKIYTK
jgi:hypothetical protein